MPGVGGESTRRRLTPSRWTTTRRSDEPVGGVVYALLLGH
jgi:hypothetical protein